MRVVMETENVREHVKKEKRLPLGTEERISSLGKRGLLRLPLPKSGLPRIRPVDIKGIPVSKIIIEERR